MEIRINSWWFSIWGLFVHDSHITGPFSEETIQEWINEGLQGTGYTVMCPEESGRRSWNLNHDDDYGSCVLKRRLHTSTDAEAEIKKLAPAAHEMLAEIDTQTFSV